MVRGCDSSDLLILGNLQKEICERRTRYVPVYVVDAAGSPVLHKINVTENTRSQ